MSETERAALLRLVAVVESVNNVLAQLVIGVENADTILANRDRLNDIRRDLVTAALQGPGEPSVWADGQEE